MQKDNKWPKLDLYHDSIYKVYCYDYWSGIPPHLGYDLVGRTRVCNNPRSCISPYD